MPDHGGVVDVTLLESAASGYRFPALVAAGTVGAAIRVRGAQGVQRLAVSAVLVLAVPPVVHWAVGGGAVFPTPGGTRSRCSPWWASSRARWTSSPSNGPA